MTKFAFFKRFPQLIIYQMVTFLAQGLKVKRAETKQTGNLKMKNQNQTYKDESFDSKRKRLYKTIFKALIGVALVLFIHNILTNNF